MDKESPFLTYVELPIYETHQTISGHKLTSQSIFISVIAIINVCQFILLVPQ